ncbi:hypothetical protein [Planococcus halocryophilus]|uniref:hypothetical protein n=1 Tax=Planococcus halocryophilus TaxID=1215089 RepID=UPI001F0F8D67|nr:hypothetical protein [Planococcus halocryophilus]MCH4825596.1 hypothetical protein [Planococcus halocryophilus]
MSNEVWNNGSGGYFGYTEDTSLMSRINRNKKWRIAAEYHDSATGKRIAVQYTIPQEERRAALYMFNIAAISE